MLQKRGLLNIESIIRNKEGELLTVDTDGTCYILKSYFEGRECNVRDPEECRSAMRTLAKLHRICATDELPQYPGSFYTVNQSEDGF